MTNIRILCNKSYVFLVNTREYLYDWNKLFVNNYNLKLIILVYFIVNAWPSDVISNKIVQPSTIIK